MSETNLSVRGIISIDYRLNQAGLDYLVHRLDGAHQPNMPVSAAMSERLVAQAGKPNRPRQ